MKKNLSRHIVLKFLFSACILSGYSASAQSGRAASNDTVTTGIDTVFQAYEISPFLQVRKDLSLISSSSVSGAVLSQTPTANISNTLVGRLPGLIVRQGSGEPGYDGASLSIRGSGTFDNQGITIYVDGFQTNWAYFQYLSTSEIESISILKDAAALSTFGMKGANGVLWVVTKRGAIGKPKVSVQLTSGLRQARNMVKPLGSYDYARLYNQAISNDNYFVNQNALVWTPKYSSTELAAYQNGTGTNVSWYDETLKETSPYTNANVLFSGGNTTTRYAVVADVMRDNGLYDIKNTDKTSNAQIQRFNLRSNLDFSFFKVFEAKVDLGGRIEDRRYPNISGPFLWQNLASYPSNIYPVKDPANGMWSGTSIYPNNPVASLNALGWASTHDRTLQANFLLKEKLDFITPGLYLSQSLSFNTWTRSSSSKTATYARFFNGARTTTDVQTDISSNGTSPTNQYDWKQANLTAGYSSSFGPHSVAAALNYFISDYTLDGNTNFAGQNTGNNIFYHFNNLGGRLHYAFDSKYLAEFSFGYSGSDNYAPGNRWGFYPAFAAGWIVSKESFLQDNNVIDFLKLRASVGKSGNDLSNSGRFLYQQYYSGGPTFYTGNTGLNNKATTFPSYEANPDIFAEESMKYNAGLEVTLFKKLNVTADAFVDNRSGIVIVNNQIPGVLGKPLPYNNIGKMRNRGFEVGANFTNSINDLQYNIGGWAAFNKNKILYSAEIPTANSFSMRTGNSLGSHFGLVADGFYDITDFEANGSLKAGNPVPAFGSVQPGDLRYLDLDGNNRVDENDERVIGNPTLPNFTYVINAGLNFKNFDLGFLFQGSSGNDINLLASANNQSVAFVNNANIFPLASKAWAYYPSEGIDTRASATYPRLTTKANANNYRNSSFWIKSGSFLRLNNVEVGYSLPNTLLSKVNIEKLRIYVNAVNPVTWSSIENEYGMDPEILSGYPGLKSINTGISLTF